jgi:hypothetical protein
MGVPKALAHKPTNKTTNKGKKLYMGTSGKKLYIVEYAGNNRYQINSRF